MTTDETRQKIDVEPDFIALKRYSYSLERLMERYPEGCPDHVIAQALLVTEDDVEAIYQKIVTRLQALLRVE